MTCTPLLLLRRDAARNMARFYQLSLEPDLFQGMALTRHWGRIGTKGRFRVELFVSPDLAERRMARLADAKQRRGYRAAEGTS